MIKSKYKTIIWDWNGTLLNDVEACVNITNKLLLNHNDLQLTKSSYKDVFGFPITAYYDRIGMDFDIESFEILTHKFISNYNTDILKCHLHKNVEFVLNRFRELGIAQYILTAAHKNSVLKLLDHFNLRNYFIEIEGLDNFRAESKIDRGIALLKDNNIDNKTAVLIGDTIHDFEVAEAIGVNCILIANGHQSKERLISKVSKETKVLDEIEFLLAHN